MTLCKNIYVCLPATMKVINDILDQRRGHGLMDVTRSQ